MPDFANRGAFDAGPAEAMKGIIAPRPCDVKVGTTLYRFGTTPGHAIGGGWWTEENQFAFLRNWAIVNALPLPHAARALSGVAHQWNEMLCLVRARVTTPLLAWEGQGSRQIVGAGRKNAGEFFEPAASPSAASFLQMYIPGLGDPIISGASLTCLSAEYFTAADSEIGGVVGIPSGAARH